MEMRNILLIDDEKRLALILQKFLEKEEYKVDLSYTGEEALKKIEENFYDIIIADFSIPDVNGMEILKFVKKRLKENIIFIMITGYGTIERAIEATKNGADAFIKKPFELEELSLTLKKLIKSKSIENELKSIKEKKIKDYSVNSIIGISNDIKKIKKQILDIADFDANVLITGESGTGKELIAKALHYNSKRKIHPFFAVNCSAIPENLLESEFFGYVKGSFTGAYTDRKGLFEEANGSTLFLDEIGDLPISMQAKILRALQENKIKRIGDVKELDIDFRLISATSKRLEEEVFHKRFREDLFYRINVINIRIPSLRERKEDIPVLIEHFLNKFSIKFNVEKKEISQNALDFLFDYSFPGNVRELENLVERATILVKKSVIDVEDLKEVFDKKQEVDFQIKINDFSLPYKEAFKKVRENFDKLYITAALKKNNYNKLKTAEYLKISPRLLHYKLKSI